MSEPEPYQDLFLKLCPVTPTTWRIKKAPFFNNYKLKIVFLELPSFTPQSVNSHNKKQSSTAIILKQIYRNKTYVYLKLNGEHIENKNGRKSQILKDKARTIFDNKQISIKMCLYICTLSAVLQKAIGPAVASYGANSIST